MHIDPNDCTKYFVCPGPIATAQPYECDPKKKLVFSVEKKLCVDRKSNAQCKKVDCAKKGNEFLPFPGHAGYFAFCSTDQGTLMFKCLDDINEVFDVDANQCVYNCKRAGFYVDRTSCEDYYVCQRIGGKWTANKRSCPKNYKFDGTMCVYDPECQPEIRTTPYEPPTTTETEETPPEV